MIDWNNDGKIDTEDWIITGIVFDDEDESQKRRGGGCFTSMLLFVMLSGGLMFNICSFFI